MRVLIAVTVAALLVGCASTTMDEARARTPNKTLSSAKADQLVAQCVQFSWQDEAVFGVDAAAYLQPGKTGGYTVYTRSAESFVDIKADTAGTSVRFYAVEESYVSKRRLAALATCL